MKKRIKYFFMIFLLLINIGNVKALTVSKNDITIEKGGSGKVELYANTTEKVKRVDFTLVFSTYDIPAAFYANSAYTDTNPDGITHSVLLREATSGKILLGTIDINVKASPNDLAGSVSIHTASAIMENDEKVSLNAQTINVKVGTPEVEEPTPTPSPTTTPSPTPSEPSNKSDEDLLLDKIKSSITAINLKKGVYEYNVKIKDSVTELDLKPVAKDSKTKIDITTQKIKDLKDNKIIITAELDDIKQVYTINVSLKDKNEIVIDKGEFVADTSYKSKWIIMSIILIGALAGSVIISKKK